MLEIVRSNVSDNPAVMTCESIMAVLAHEGCPELDWMASRDYAFPEYSELEDDIARIQAVKKSFIRRFWKVSGREVVREVAQRRLEEVGFLIAYYFFCCFNLHIWLY